MAYPAPKPKRTNPIRQTRMLLVVDPSGCVLLERRPPSGIWGGLWVPPELASGQEADDWCRAHLGSGSAPLEMLPPRRHTFSHFQLDIQPLVARLNAAPTVIADNGARAWVDPATPGGIGLPAPIRRLLHEIAEAVFPGDADQINHDNIGEPS